MSDWRKEFQYLLDRKILSRDELGYLFGQIKSIINRELVKNKLTNKRLKDYVESLIRSEHSMFDEIDEKCPCYECVVSRSAEQILKEGKDE
ncbi:hypothetical protein LCGC14_0800560 [marine sediment metagenome]|uniref:Uncharacterized protein n=1 Tax=marine sediment metagenome TaxID=412755 RepID=A0A0F9Q9J9_9ZZZZ